jgi:indolepyruvate ferredoxin oxidoreductase alpha subunit
MGKVGTIIVSSLAVILVAAIIFFGFTPTGKGILVGYENEMKEVDEAFDAFWDLDEPSVIITRYPCVLKKFSPADLEQWPGLFQSKNVVDAEKCIGCKLCQKTGCPALIFDKAAKKVVINRADCVGCDVCTQVCPKDAIVKEEK